MNTCGISVIFVLGCFIMFGKPAQAELSALDIGQVTHLQVMLEQQAMYLTSHSSQAIE